MLSSSGGSKAHNMTARFAQADINMNQPAIGRYQTAAVRIAYSQNTCICSHTSPFHKELPSEARARTERMKAASRAVASAAAKYTSGMMTMPTRSLIRTAEASEIGNDFQNRMLRSRRSVYKQSSKYQVEYTDITRKNRMPTTPRKPAAAACDSCEELSRGMLTCPNSAASNKSPPNTAGISQIARFSQNSRRISHVLLFMLHLPKASRQRDRKRSACEFRRTPRSCRDRRSRNRGPSSREYGVRRKVSPRAQHRGGPRLP